MKICDFCGTMNTDDAVKCKSCGSTSLKNKCNNCGAVFDGQFCTGCGTRSGQEAKECPVCHTKYFTAACPSCGYVPGKTSGVTSAPAPQTPAAPKRKTWLWVLGWIFIFPLPLMLILKKKSDMENKLKHGIIIGAWVIYGILLIIGMLNNANKPKEVNQYIPAAEAVTEAPTVKPTKTPTVSATDSPTKAPTEPETEKETEAPTEAPTPITFTEYTDSVKAGSDAFVTVQGAPNTDYSIHVFYDSGESKASGLEKKTSDDNGFVTWEWKVGTSTEPGAYTITVEGNRTSESVSFNVYH